MFFGQSGMPNPENEIPPAIEVVFFSGIILKKWLTVVNLCVILNVVYRSSPRRRLIQWIMYRSGSLKQDLPI